MEGECVDCKYCEGYCQPYEGWSFTCSYPDETSDYFKETGRYDFIGVGPYDDCWLKPNRWEKR